MSTRTRELTWAIVDVDDDAEMDLFRRQQGQKERAREAVKRLREQGIMDAHGRRVRKDLPPDMREGSECDLG